MTFYFVLCQNCDQGDSSSQQPQGNSNVTACRCVDGFSFSDANLQHGKAKRQQLTGSKYTTFNQAAATRPAQCMVTATATEK